MMDINNPAMDPDLEWEPVPETLKDDETFVHAVWDIVRSHPDSPPNDVAPPSSPSPSPSSYDFDIECIDLYMLSSETHIQRNTDVKTVSEALILNSYIGVTPQSPSIAISLHTLKLYSRICLQKLSFSAEAFTKMPYCRRYQTSLVGTFDVYNIILHQVELQVSEALGQNSPNWHVLNAFGDTCMFDLDFFLSHDYVNLFADEVSSSQAPSSQAPAEQNALQLQVDENREKPCMENWKAAADEAKKKMWGIFEETGIFACACHHGMMLWIVDMVCSGELYYPLSIMNKALDVLSPQLLIRYDVRCKLATTIKTTSLATKFNESDSRLCIDAFHGYTHNYACQDKNHPNIIQGMGLEDFSTMERIFSSSNQLAPIIHYASVYNCHFFIDMFFKQWDEDKYTNIGNMLYNNYCQALNIIERKTIEFEHMKLTLGITDENIEEWQKQQSAYLETLGKEAEWDMHAMTYTEAAAQNALVSFLNAIPADYQFVLTSTVTSTDPTYAINLISQEVVAMEVKMGITRRWEPSDSKYAETMKYMATWKYHCYRMRTHIAKALQTRCKAIQTKVKEYNAAASVLEPPAPSLDWSHVSHYGFLDEFMLLRETCQDVQMNQWTHPEVRELMCQSLHIKRAHEEVYCCNIELCRLHSSIAAENCHFEATLQCLKNKNSTLYYSVKEFAMCRIRINSHNLAHIFQTFGLAGFTGDKTVGVKKNLSTLPNHSLMHMDTLADQQPENDEAESDMDEDNDACRVVGGLLDYVSELPSRSISL
ncbi:hypothetical protein EDD22DRAFT_982276 [Suillus occidentalis]|nr:hypothetical protein EDD22DRAFT_982276 [Suillus occidentalis]